jgi:hypothetical protein
MSKSKFETKTSDKIHVMDTRNRNVYVVVRMTPKMMYVVTKVEFQRNETQNAKRINKKFLKTL